MYTFYLRGTTLLLELDDLKSMEINYKPGDHLGVFACNRSELVEGILKRLESPFEADASIELQMQKQSHTPNGIVKTWLPHDRYLPNTLRMLLTRFLDITTPPSPNLLRYFASMATNPIEQAQLNLLATVRLFKFTPQINFSFFPIKSPKLLRF